MKLSILAQTHPEYMRDTWQELGDFYAGGYQLLRNASRYLPQVSGEHHSRYTDRLTSIGYINHFGQIVDYFAAALFTRSLAIMPAADADNPDTPGTEPKEPAFYASFSHNADLAGTPFTSLLKQAFTTALVKRRAYVAIDMPSADGVQPSSLADEELLGLRNAYAFEAPVEELLDWEIDQFGNYVWAVLRRCYRTRKSPAEMRGGQIDEFKVWEMQGGNAVFSIYCTPPYDPGSALGDEFDVPQVVLRRATSFKRIPIVDLVLPEGLWVGNKIGHLAREAFQRRSLLVAAQAKSLVAIPFIKRGPEISAPGGAMPAETQQNPHRGTDPVQEFAARGWLAIGADDELGYAEPDGKCYELTDRQLKDLKDELFRVVHQMAASVDNKSGSMRRSGESKKMDHMSEAIVLGAFGELVRDFGRRIFECVSESRGDKIVWTAHGLDDYMTEDEDDLFDRATKLDQVSVPSKTFKRILKTRYALKMVPNIDPETQQVIQDEIEAGVTDEEGTLAAANALLKDADGNHAEPDADDDGGPSDGDADNVGASAPKVAPKAPGKRSRAPRSAARKAL